MKNRSKFFNCPRSFLFSEVPFYEGKALHDLGSEVEFFFYFKWLVGYLEQLLREKIPEGQRLALRKMNHLDPVFAVRFLSKDAFHHIKRMTILHSWYIAKNIPYHEALTQLRSSWEEGARWFYGEKIEHFEDLINPQLWWQANLEWREERAMPVPAKHPDIGYRVVLAQTLARVGPEQERVALVDHFYDIFHRDRFN